MHVLEELLNGNYRAEKAIQLRCNLKTVPSALLKCKELERLDLSGNELSTLPDEFTELRNLQILFASDNCFETYPPVLAKMPKLRMVAFRNNGMKSIEEGSLNVGLRWLILTNNNLSRLPKSIGLCSQMQKLMLAGNLLEHLPIEMSQLGRLELLRLSVNKFRNIPDWIFNLPSLAFFAFGGNPMINSDQQDTLAELPWDDFVCAEILGEGASGVIHKATWVSAGVQVAIKLFKGQLTSDGSPKDEMLACMAAGQHDHIIDTLAEVCKHPQRQKGLILQLIPESYTILAGPPSLGTCTRDVFQEQQSFSWVVVQNILESVADAAAHLHGRGISHGDLYAHNTLVNEHGHGLLGDFGAATVYGSEHNFASLLEKVEVRAFGHMIDDLLSRCEHPNTSTTAVKVVDSLRRDCLLPVVQHRPTFNDILRRLKAI